jgi:hypothetical protein
VTGERRLLRAGECLIRCACLLLPPGNRDERYREWAAELPEILHDPDVRLAPARAALMLAYAADQARGIVSLDRLRHAAAASRLCKGLLLVASFSSMTAFLVTFPGSHSVTDYLYSAVMFPVVTVVTARTYFAVVESGDSEWG